jgi:glycosyltransferase involved in cell wall biosynthesis
MKVLMTADAVGGVWTYTLDLCRALAEHHVRIDLAVLGPPPSDAQRDEAAALTNVTLHGHTGRLEWMDDPWTDVDAAATWLLELEQRVRPDVVHLKGYSHAALPWRAPVVFVAQSCVLSWWRSVRGEDAPLSFHHYGERVRRGLTAANLVVAPSAAMLNALQTHYGPMTHVRVIANGRFAPANTPSIVEREPFLLAAGRLWDDAKNIAAVCRVAPSLPWPVHVAGDTHAPGSEGKPCDGVRYLGRLDAATLFSEMQRASIYALPARYEPFGLSVLEAAMAGCALVIGDIGSLREVWGSAATYVPPGDDAALSRALMRLIGDEALRHEMARRAHARARTFDPRRMAAAYHHAYAELTSEVRPLLSLSTV